VPSVGEHTYLVVYGPDDSHGRELLSDGQLFFNEQFKKYGPQELNPQDLDAAIANPKFFGPAID
jgi:hypothetical protein